MKTLVQNDTAQMTRWQYIDHISRKNGPHSLIYMANGDKYTGEWKDDKRHGSGRWISRLKGVIYDGEWAYDLKNGHGTFSIPVGEYHPPSRQLKPKPQSKEFALLAAVSVPDEDVMGSIRKRQAAKNKSASSSSDQEHPTRKVYVGEFKDDLFHGNGSFFYLDGGIYEGEWVAGKRCGWGKMEFADGSIYIGEWFNDNRHGQGELLLQNGDRYEGMWLNDKKEGPGKFIYRNRRQMYEGEWSLGQPKCGTLKDLPPLQGQAPRKYLIPAIELAEPERLLEEERRALVEEREERML